MTRDFNQTRWAQSPRLPAFVCRTIGVSALVGLGCFSLTANATVKTDFGVDYQATGFYVQSDQFRVREGADSGSGSDNDNGFAQYIRLKANLKHEETGIEVHTRIELAGDRWSGDARTYQTTADQAFNSSNNGDNVRLDLGFVQIPFKLGLLRIGRQEANWSNGFLVSDDRRDRVLFLSKLGGASAFAGYDRRQDTVTFENSDNGDQGFAGAVIPLTDSVNLGLLYVHWFDNANGDLTDLAAEHGNAPYVLSKANLFSPYLSGTLGPVSIDTGFNYVRDGEINNNLTLNAGGDSADGDYFSENAWSEYFRIGAEVGVFELKAQYVGTQDGGLVSPGFDTFSSLINSNPESTANPTSLYRMGGFLGREGFNENLYIGSVTANVTPKFALRGSVGVLNIETPDRFAVTADGPVAVDGDNDSSMVYDLQASYQLNEVLRTWATLGMLDKNSAGTLAGNSLIGSIPNGGSFADDRVWAGSVNLGLEF